MTLGVILIIISLGLVLIFVEMFVIPGTALFGILGGIAVIVGVALIYSNYGSHWGNITALVTVVALAVTVYAGFKTISSGRVAMKAEIKSRVNEVEKHLYKVGEHGVAFTELRPNGKAVFGENRIEVFSTGEYVQRGSTIEIIKVTGDKIFVKPINS